MCQSNKGVWVVASREVSVYVVNKEAENTDPYLALLVDVLSTDMTFVVDWASKPIIFISTYLPTYLPTYLHTYLPAYLHTYLPTCLPI